MSVSDTLLDAVPDSPAAGVRLLARLGFAAIGVVYVLMGALALLAAVGLQRSNQAGQREAVQHLQSLPGGRVLLGLVAVGLLSYIVWRFTQAIADTEKEGTDARGIGLRLGYACSGLFYSGLALYAGRLALYGRAAAAGGHVPRTLTATVLGWPGGQWLILLVGVGVVGFGLYQGYRAFWGHLGSSIDASTFSAMQRHFLQRAAQVGLTARGVVVVIIGVFFVRAGWQARASVVGNTDEAFDLLAAIGSVPLGVVGAGLAIYGLHSLVQARYPVLRSL